MLSAAIVDWPTYMVAQLWGPLVMVFLGTFTAICWITTRMTPDQLAQKKLDMQRQKIRDKFDGLGLSDELIQKGIIAPLEATFLIDDWAGKIQNPKVHHELNLMSEEIQIMIDDFKNDTTDINRSRSLLKKCTGQALKIAEQFYILESKDGNHISAALLNQTISGLQRINGAIAEQHRRNTDNNQMALAVDLDVTDQVFSPLIED